MKVIIITIIINIATITTGEDINPTIRKGIKMEVVAIERSDTITALANNTSYKTKPGKIYGKPLLKRIIYQQAVIAYMIKF